MSKRKSTGAGSGQSDRDLAHMQEMGMKSGSEALLNELKPNLSTSFGSHANKAKAVVNMLLDSLLVSGPPLGSSAGDQPALVDGVRRSLKAVNASLLSMAHTRRQGTEVVAAVKEVSKPPFRLGQGETFEELLQGQIKRLGPGSKEVVKDVEEPGWYAQLKKHMREKRDADEEEVELTVSMDLKTRVTCPVSMAIMNQPVKNPACGHCFDKDSILSLLGSKPSISCPQKGCTKLCTRASLQDSEELLAHVQTYKRMLAQQEEEEAAAAAAKEGRGGAAAAAKKRKVVETEEEEE